MKIFFIVCILFYTNFCLAEENIKITTEGSGISKRLAIQDALKTAVDDAAGVTIDTNTIIVNNRLSGSKISSYSGGYIKEYTILEEKYENKIYYVKIEAIVATGSPDIQENNINTFIGFILFSLLFISLVSQASLETFSQISSESEFQSSSELISIF